eukprot:GHVS01051139.1.p1 GENE.GHVS01051139.1~~GHVS01051139.1.p1  ORF type:complete len:299 (+),score=28.24 GHVS01051139.1:122-1018(+)
MQFTPQQLSGGPNFHHHCRIGNWNEDRCLEEVRLQEFQQKQQAGNLVGVSKVSRSARCNKTVEVTNFRNKQTLDFGDEITLLNGDTKATLAVDPYDVVPKDEGSCFTITVCPNTKPRSRNVFVIKPADDSSVGNLFYGQPFRLGLHPSLQSPQEMYVQSEAASHLSGAKFSRHQEVFASPIPTPNTLWKMVYPYCSLRFEMDGHPLDPSLPIVIKHVLTGTALASTTSVKYPTTFGVDYEVHGKNYYPASNAPNCVLESTGLTTSDIDLKQHQSPNMWFLNCDGCDANQEDIQTKLIS